MNTDTCQELESSGHKVSKSLIIDDFELNCLTKSHICDNLPLNGDLVLLCEEGNLQVLYSVEPWVVFVVGVYKVLDLSHCELSYSKETLFWVNFISKTKANLSSCEWHPAIVEV